MSVFPTVPFHSIVHEGDCVQKYGLIHMEDAVKTVTKFGFKKIYFELPLKEIETVFGGLFICRIVRWLGRGCVCDEFAGSVSVMKLSGSKETPPPRFPPTQSWDRAQQLPSLVFFTDVCLQLNDLHVNTEGMWNRTDSMSVSSLGFETISISTRLDLPYT
jgi:hypothetical protein